PRSSAEVQQLLEQLLAAPAAPPSRPGPPSPEDRKALLGALPPGLLGQRDRALFLLAYCADLRRGELVALQVEHLVPTRRGLTVRVPGSRARLVDLEREEEHPEFC